MSAFDDACAAADRLHDDNNGDASRVGAELPNQLQAASDAIAKLEDALNDHATQSKETRELMRDARAGLDNVLKLAKHMRGGR